MKEYGYKPSEEERKEFEDQEIIEELEARLTRKNKELESLRAELDKAQQNHRGSSNAAQKWKNAYNELHAELDKARAELAKALAGEWVEMDFDDLPEETQLKLHGGGHFVKRISGNGRNAVWDEEPPNGEGRGFPCVLHGPVLVKVAPDPRVPELQRENNDLDSKLQEAQERNSALHAEIAELKDDAERWRAMVWDYKRAGCHYFGHQGGFHGSFDWSESSQFKEASEAIAPVVEEWQKAQAAEALTDLVNQMHSERKLGEAVNFSDLLDDVQPVTVPKKVLDSMPVDVKAGKFVLEEKPKRWKVRVAHLEQNQQFWKYGHKGTIMEKSIKAVNIKKAPVETDALATIDGWDEPVRLAPDSYVEVEELGEEESE